MSLVKFFGVDKIQKLMRMVKNHGGVKATLYHLYRTDDLKEGKLVGEDKYGNKYYENPEYFYGRNRWVIYNAKVGVDYDGSMIPPEWYGWMHYKTDLPPTIKAPVKYDWMVDHTTPFKNFGIEVEQGNVSGSKNAYYPYTTTKPKIESWVPPSK